MKPSWYSEWIISVRIKETVKKQTKLTLRSENVSFSPLSIRLQTWYVLPRLIGQILCTGTSCSCKKHATQHFSQIPLSTQKVFDESSRALGDRGWGWRRRNRAVCVCMLGLYRVINQIPGKCASRSCRIPARLSLKESVPPPNFPTTPHPQVHWELEDLEAHWSSICLGAARSHAEFRQQNTQQLKEGLTCFISLMG